MKNPILIFAFFSVSALTQAQQSTPLKLVQTITLPDVEGRIDHLGVDVKGRRIFVAALGNNTLEVLDLREGKRIHSITGLAEPQGVFYVPENNRIFVANGKDGTLRIFDGSSFRPVDTIRYSDDADNVRYDRATRRIYVGYGSGALGIVDAGSGKRLGDIQLEAHPESFQLEENGRGMFVNVPTAGHIAVIDRQRSSVVAKWPVEGAKANFPMALDEAHGRLFVTCRKPAEMIVYDAATGKIVARRPVVGDADDMFYDAARRRIYISGGEGFLSVLEQGDNDHYRLIAKIPTAAGARTSRFVPEFRRLYLAVPRRGSQGAEVRAYEVQP